MVKSVAIAAGVLVALSAIAKSAGDQTSTGSHIYLTVIDRDPKSDVIPKAQIEMLGGTEKAIPVSPVVKSIAPGIHELDFRLPSGDYFVSVAAGFGDAREEVTVLQDHNRHLVAKTSGTDYFGPSCSVAGSLPVPGLSVRLINASGHDERVTVDGDAYYSGEFGRGKFTLEVGMMYPDVVDIPLDYSDQSAGEFCDKKLVRNITLDDLRSATP